MNIQGLMEKQVQCEFETIDGQTLDVLIEAAKSIGFTEAELQQLTKIYGQDRKLKQK